MEENAITEKILKCAFRVHTALGPGLLENAYKECLLYELRKNGLFAEKEKALPLIYEDVKLECAYKMDIFVENKVIIELKAVEKLHPVHEVQLLTYLRLAKCKVGLLLNFHELYLKNGIVRKINGY